MKQINQDNIFCTLETIHHVGQDYHYSHPQMIHRHDKELELLYITRGMGQYIVNGKRYVVQAGNLIICRPGILHGENADFKNSMESYCLVLKDVNLQGPGQALLQEITCNPILTMNEDQNTYENLLFALNSIFEKNHQHPTCDLLARAILSFVIEKLTIRHEEVDEILDDAPDHFVYKVIEYLNQHFTDPISLESLSSYFHISQSYLSHIFKEQTGIGAMKYVMHLKIGQAQTLLINTDQSIGDISYELGFNDNSHFNIMFKKYVGLSPTQYRQNFRKNSFLHT